MKNKLTICLVWLFFFSFAQGQTESPKVLIHYMGWFGANSTGNHWSCGQTRTPLIGYYNSQSWATIAYHILLSWSCGIDGLVINVKDNYDARTLDMIMQTISRLNDIDSVNFKYCFSISYDDQGLPNLSAAEAKFTYLRDNILPKTKNFLTYSGIPVIFLFQYGALTPAQYHTALTNTFPLSTPKLIRNEIDANALVYASSFYSWVQPGSGGWNGTNWGQDYLSWYYNTMKSLSSSVSFTCGGVWAGFNDSINHCWGLNRGMDRQNGTLYNSTWSFVNNYSGNPPMKFVYIATWNDWNEGTEIEPSKEYRYQYLKSTINNINTFKGTSISDDTCKYEAAGKIYKAAYGIEESLVDSGLYYPLLERAIISFLQNKCDESIYQSDSIIQAFSETGISNKKINHASNVIDIFPNPAQSLVKLHISLPTNAQSLLTIIDANGKTVETLYSGFLPAGEKTIIWNTSKIKKGIYFCIMTINGERQSRKLIII
jgi:hypothetical protein